MDANADSRAQSIAPGRRPWTPPRIIRSAEIEDAEKFVNDSEFTFENIPADAFGPS